MRKFLSLLLAVALVVSIFSGCSGGGSSASGTEESGGGMAGGAATDSITIAIYQDIKTLDPHNSGMTIDKVVYQNVFDCLLNQYEGEYEKVLVDDYSMSEDGTEYTFNLKKGVKFHNGEELKASDVVFSMERAKTSTNLASYTACIDTVTATDDYTVVFKLTEPYVPFLMSVASFVPIMNEKATTESENVNYNPVGTGPYKFVEYATGQDVKLTRFDEWHGGSAPIKDVTFTVLTDTNASLMAVESGDVDMTYSIPSIAVSSVEENKDLGIQLIPTIGSCYIAYNIEKAPFDDVNFRLALAYATNRQEIIDVAMDGMAESTDVLWTEEWAGDSDVYRCKPYDVEKAKEYLAKSNYNGETITYVAGSDEYKKIGVVLQEQYKAVGINMEVEQLETNTWVSDMMNGNYDITFTGMSFDLDVDLWKNALHSSAIGGYNFSRLNNAEVDVAFDKGTAILDEAERAKNYEVIEKVLYEDAILIPVYFKVSPCVYNANLKVNRTYPLGFAKVADLEWTA